MAVWKIKRIFLTPACLWCYLVGSTNSCASKYSASSVYLKFKAIIFSSRNQKLRAVSVHIGGGKGKGNDHFCMLAAEVGLFSASLFCELIGTVTVGSNTQCIMRRKSLDSSTALLLSISWSSGAEGLDFWSSGGHFSHRRLLPTFLILITIEILCLVVIYIKAPGEAVE